MRRSVSEKPRRWRRSCCGTDEELGHRRVGPLHLDQVRVVQRLWRAHRDPAANRIVLVARGATRAMPRSRRARTPTARPSAASSSGPCAKPSGANGPIASRTLRARIRSSSVHCGAPGLGGLASDLVDFEERQRGGRDRRAPRPSCPQSGPASSPAGLPSLRRAPRPGRASTPSPRRRVGLASSRSPCGSAISDRFSERCRGSPRARPRRRTACRRTGRRRAPPRAALRSSARASSPAPSTPGMPRTEPWLRAPFRRTTGRRRRAGRGASRHRRGPRSRSRRCPSASSGSAHPAPRAPRRRPVEPAHRPHSWNWLSCPVYQRFRGYPRSRRRSHIKATWPRSPRARPSRRRPGRHSFLSPSAGTNAVCAASPFSKPK